MADLGRIHVPTHLDVDVIRVLNRYASRGLRESAQGARRLQSLPGYARLLLAHCGELRVLAFSV